MEKSDAKSLGHLEAQWMRGHHTAVLHHSHGDLAHVLEALPSVAGPQCLQVLHNPVMGLHETERERE